MPARPETQTATTDWSDLTTTTILLGKDHKVYYYYGTGYDIQGNATIQQTTNIGIRSVIIDKKKVVKELVDKGIISKNREAAFIIKATEYSTFNDFVRILDEMNINEVRMKAVVDITDADRAFIHYRLKAHELVEKPY